MQADWEHWYLRAWGAAHIYTVSLMGAGKYMHSASCLYLQFGTRLTFAALGRERRGRGWGGGGAQQVKERILVLCVWIKSLNNQDVRSSPLNSVIVFAQFVQHLQIHQIYHWLTKMMFRFFSFFSAENIPLMTSHPHSLQRLTSPKPFQRRGRSRKRMGPIVGVWQASRPVRLVCAAVLLLIVRKRLH